MINAQDLRIGNWVNNYYTGAESVSVGLLNMLEQFNPDLHQQIYSGIPLTEDILLKCGFTKHGAKYTINNFDLYDFEYHANGNDFKGWLVPLTDGDFFMSGKFVEIKYLHELQNIYHVHKKQELNIKL